MSQDVDSDLFLHTDDTCLLYQHKEQEGIKVELTKNLSIHFGKDETKFILFTTKNKKRKEDWNIRN